MGLLSTGGVTLISQGTGYGLLIGLAILFCGVILIAVKIQKTYLLEDSGKSEMFMVANRTVGTGLTSSAVFSSWMWINETAFSAVNCYRFGIAAPMWYGSALSFQIALMAVLGVLAKIRVPYAHTSLEIIRIRYGQVGHIVFIILNLCQNIFGCSSMILAGSQLIYGVSGMHIAAATILLPVGVVLYTAVGGLKATFLTDFFHTAIALILIIYFTIGVLVHEKIGGLSGLYDKVMALEDHIDGNYAGSLLSFKSKGAIMFGLDLKFGNMALVVMDTAFWQKSFATEVNATVPGYNLAALAIFAVPWALGTVIGLAARVIHTQPIFPTYPQSFTESEVLSGFVMPYTIQALLGHGGVVAFFLLLFMSLTSTVSSSMIAVSSILSFDLYKQYINPKASDKRLVSVSHLAVCFHGIFISGFSLALNYGGANMNWLGYFIPILTCPGIMPLIFTLSWSGQTRLAAVISPLLGLVTGLAIWLGSTYSIYGTLNMDTTQEQAPCLYGAIGSLFSPALYSILISFYKPYTFDWREFLRIELVSENTPPQETGSETETATTGIATAETIKQPSTNEKDIPVSSTTPAAATTTTTDSDSDNSNNNNSDNDNVSSPFDKQTLQSLHQWYRIAWIMFIAIVLLTFLLWPMPLYRDWVFNKAFFSGWVVVAIIWQFFAFAAVVVYPLWDGRHEILQGARGVKGTVTRLFETLTC